MRGNKATHSMSGPAGPRTRRRQLLAAAGIVAGVSPLVACGTGGTAQPAAQSAQPVTLQWGTDWTGGARGDATTQSIPAFEAQFPRIKLDMRASAGDVYETFVSNLAAGTLPDVMLFSGNLFQEWAEKGAFIDISASLKKAKWDMESIWWEPLNFEFNKKIHGLPYQFVVNTWIYNKTWFRQQGVAPPTDAWTTDDLLEAGKKLNLPAENRWAIQMNAAPGFAWPWLYANGADLTTYATPLRTAIDAPKCIEVWNYAVDLIQRYRVAPVPGGPNQTKGVAAFQAGGVAMTTNNSAKGLVSTIKNQFEWDVMPTPRWGPTKKRVTGNNNQQGHIVLKTAEQRGHVDAATQFVMWMAGEGGQQIVARTGGATPVHKKTAYGPLYIDGSPPGLKLQLDLLTKKPDQDYRGFRIIKYFSQWYAAVGPILDKGFNGEISVQEMATQATRAGNGVLDTLK